MQCVSNIHEIWYIGGVTVRLPRIRWCGTKSSKTQTPMTISSSFHHFTHLKIEEVVFLSYQIQLTQVSKSIITDLMWDQFWSRLDTEYCTSIIDTAQFSILHARMTISESLRVGLPQFYLIYLLRPVEMNLERGAVEWLKIPS